MIRAVEVPSKDVTVAAGGLKTYGILQGGAVHRGMLSFRGREVYQPLYRRSCTIGLTDTKYLRYMGLGIDPCNVGGERIRDRANLHTLIVVKIVFRKRDPHLVLDYGGNSKTYRHK